MRNFSLLILLLALCIGVSSVKAQTTFWDKTQRVTRGFVDKNPTFDSRRTINHELLFISFLLFERQTSQGGSNICYLRFGYDSAFSSVGYITNDSGVINRNQKFAFKETSWFYDSIRNAMAVWERVENSRVNIYGSTYSNGSWSIPYPIDTGAGNKRSPNISYNTQQSTMNIYCIVYEKEGDIIFKNYESTTHQVLNETNLTEGDTAFCRNPKVSSLFDMAQPLFITYERQKPNGDFAISYKKSGSNYVFTGDTISTRGNNRNAEFINGMGNVAMAFESNYSGKWGIYEYQYNNSFIYTLLQNSVINYRNLKNYIYPMITNSPALFNSMLTSYIVQKGNTTKIYSTVNLAPPMDSINTGDTASGCILTMSTGIIKTGSSTGRLWIVYTKDSAGYSMLESAGKLIPLGDVKMIGSEIPGSFRLMQNYPNPFNAETVVRFSLSVDSKVSIKVYDVQGREVRTLVNGRMNAGTYEVNFNGDYLSSGVYFYKMNTGNFSETKRMILVK